jgi:ElaB/YqjD/DUF883 family membrane-anchored ribosome-binding protein
MDRFRNGKSTPSTVRPFVNGLRQAHWAETARKDLESGVRSVETFIGERPLVCLSIGLAVGFILGCLVKRT